MTRMLWLVAFGVGLGCGSEPNATPQKVSAAGPSSAAKGTAPLAATTTTVDEFLTRGKPTLVRGTLGDERSDRAIAIQVALVSSVLGDAPIVDDTSIDVKRPETWPSNPVLYGGPHVNATVAALGDALPFSMSPRTLTLGGTTLRGDDIRLITVVPAGEGDPAWPEFALYAGTGTPGIEEINAIQHGANPLLVADGFGALHTGGWTADGAQLSAPLRRIEWRGRERTLRDANVTVLFPAMIEEKPSDEVTVDAVVRGLTRVVERLEIDAPASVRVYVHPDVRSKVQNSGKGGDGHAVVTADALHVLAAEPAVLESLVAHEGTHVLAYRALGPVATPLMGEGLAVWVSGKYGGRRLDLWRLMLSPKTDRSTWRGAGFRQAPEAETYPYAGLLVEAAVETVGLPAVREHLLSATPQTWDAALAAAGTTHQALEAAIWADAKTTE